MRFYLKVSWRNIWRNTRRSLITASAMGVSLGLCMALITINDGFYEQFFDVLVQQKLGHVQVRHPLYSKTRSMHDTLKSTGVLIENINSEPTTHTTTGRLYGNALVSKEEESSGASIMGVFPETESEITGIESQIFEGRYLTQTSQFEVVVGIDLVEELSLEIGDELFLYTQASDGTMSYDLYNTVGFYQSGSVLLDRGLQMHATDLQALLILEDQLHELIVLSEDGSEEAIKNYLEKIEAIIGESKQIAPLREPPEITNYNELDIEQRDELDKSVLIQTWWESDPQIYQMMSFRDVATGIFLSIIFFIAGFGVLNTMLMTVFERTRELGLLKAVGLRPTKLIMLVVTEAALLSLLSGAIGTLLGCVLNFLLLTYGLDISGGTGEPLNMMGANFKPIIYGKIELYYQVQPIIALFVISVLASLWPAIRAARLEPVQALRQG
jgi:putative ABC transport system permease protein